MLMGMALNFMQMALFTKGFKMANATCLLIDGSRGIYVPKTFTSNFEGWQGINEEDLEILSDVGNEYY